MLRTVILILFIVFSFGCFAQKLSLSSFEPFSPKNFNDRAWFMDSLKQHYTDFVAFSEGSNWLTRGVVDAVGLQGGNAFLVHLTSFVLDTPENKMTAIPLALSQANQFLDSLRTLGFYGLKDESRIPACHSQKDTIIRGHKAVTEKGTTLTADGLQTTIVAYSAGRFRVTKYYEVQKSPSICPEQSDWKTALQVRNYLKRFFEGQSR